ncbi:hypothetical protein ABWH87_00830 [Oceaniradius stylonematis]
MLDQHLAHVGLAKRRVHRTLDVIEELSSGVLKLGLVVIGPIDPLPERVQNVRKVRLELLDGLAEFGDLGSFIAEEKPKQLEQVFGVVHPASERFLPVLPEHGRFRVLKDDVVLRVALCQLLSDFFVEVVAGVLGLPIAKRDAKAVQDRTVGADGRVLRCIVLQLGKEDQIILSRPSLQKVFECFAYRLLIDRAGIFLDPVKFIQKGLDKLSTQSIPHSRRVI